MARSLSFFSLFLVSWLAVSSVVALPAVAAPPPKAKAVAAPAKAAPAKAPAPKGAAAKLKPAVKVAAAASAFAAAGKAHADAAPGTKSGTGLSSLTPEQIAAYKPYSNYAGASYCKKEVIKTWSCGKKCDANKGFQVIDNDGDGNAVQYWFVGIDKKLGTVIVAHEGTNPTKLWSVVTDLNFLKEPLDPKLFPGMPKDVLVHRGFAKAQASTAARVLAAVKKALAQSKLKKVTIVGHSLGGAIALLDSVYLPKALKDPSVTFRTITYGQPRVGNKAFADWFDKNIPNVDRINNKNDMVPIVPGRKLGFVHTKGEKHIQDNDDWLVCPGGDNTDKRCAVGDVDNILDGNALQHLGMYDGVVIGMC